jgi:hypothetical protein
MHCEIYLRRNITCLQCKNAKPGKWHYTYMHNTLMRYRKELKIEREGKNLKTYSLFKIVIVFI